MRLLNRQSKSPCEGISCVTFPRVHCIFCKSTVPDVDVLLISSSMSVGPVPVPMFGLLKADPKFGCLHTIKS